MAFMELERLPLRVDGLSDISASVPPVASNRQWGMAGCFGKVFPLWPPFSLSPEDGLATIGYAPTAPKREAASMLRRLKYVHEPLPGRGRVNGHRGGLGRGECKEQGTGGD